MNDTSKRNIPITAVDQFDFLDHRRQQEKKQEWKNQLEKSKIVQGKKFSDLFSK